MKKLLLLLAVVVVGIGSAFTYHVFETIVHEAIDFVWYDTFNTDQNRWIVLPLALGLSVAFFGLQHWLDRKSEKSKEEGLGDVPKPVPSNYAKVLIIGFFSLVGGATLGPEAILVPACMLVGAMIGAVLFKGQKQLIMLLAAAGLMALFTAFFKSFLVGVLSLFLFLSRPGVKFKPVMLLIAVLASGSSIITLHMIEADPYIQLPGGPFDLNFSSIGFGLILLVVGYVVIWLMAYLHDQMLILRESKYLQHWLVNALIAGVGITLLYWVGGPLVEFTGNKSIMPMFSEASMLGLFGLIGILIVKIFAISWSKAIGYRGGMIFPAIFLASVLVAIVQLYNPTFNVVYGVIAVLIGGFLANRKSHVLV